MKRLITISTCFLMFGIFHSSCQSLKNKLKSKIPAKDRSAWYECGYVHKASMAEKANPMKALQKGMGETATNGKNNDLGKAAISVFYQAHQHPQSIIRFTSSTHGWETCGDAIYAGFTNKNGVGLSSTDGEFSIEGKKVEYGGMGTYYQGFKPELRGNKNIHINSSKNQKIDFTIGPAKPLEIVSINGLSKNEKIELDGSSDIVLELKGAEDDMDSKIHIQMVCKLVGTPIIYDVLVTNPKNTIRIPKECFKHFEGSPSPFAKQNTLIVNRVKETLIHGTSAGALRKIEAYMDWAPVTLSGDMVKGNVITMGFDTTKNKIISTGNNSEGKFQFKATKDQLYRASPSKKMKKIGIASFVVRGNLSAEQTTTHGDWLIKTKKWFPEISKNSWQTLTDKLYEELVVELQKSSYQIHDQEEIVNSKSYKHIKPIKNDVSVNFVEVGAHGTERILTTSSTDLWKDLSITFPSDLVHERLIKELNLDAVLAITIDLNFNFETEGLDVKVSAVAFAPGISYKTGSTYFKIDGTSTGMSLSKAKSLKGSASDQLYQMIQGPEFSKELLSAINKLKEEEKNHPELDLIWEAKN